MSKSMLDTPHLHLELINGIIYFRHKPGEIDLQTAQTIVSDRLRFFDGQSYPMLVTGEGLTNITKEARHYLVDKGTQGVVAAAMVTDSVFSTFLGNFFVRVYPPPMPVRLFNKELPAAEWLQQFVSTKEKMQSSSYDPKSQSV